MVVRPGFRAAEWLRLCRQHRQFGYLSIPRVSALMAERVAKALDASDAAAMDGLVFSSGGARQVAGAAQRRTERS